ncbi:DegV family protein [Alteribacillus iranensis]|uniref:EDD domain protein, DegV family n=1 Tax=Alteribacillus iranensis TaxID=930128 RepID=A0A1I2EIY7_9BACI|nr:DegV family protein [Alteribacillus iranensis]SFE92653.1 EDD domain protein, DegV family [Alteribacillus iranensis]
MGSIAIVTDSTAYLPKEIIDEYGITVVPLSIVFGDNAYEEGSELSIGEFYKKLGSTDQLPTTSQPSIGKFIEVFSQLGESYGEIITIHLSSGMSGTYQTALTAGQEVPEVEVYGFDSEISCTPQGYYAVEAAKMAREGATVHEILKRLTEMKKSMRAYFMVDSLTHLQRGGRLNGAQALVGSLLKIKPILHIEEKTIAPFEKIRTEKKAINRILSLFEEDAGTGVPIRAAVIHANRLEKAEDVKKRLLNQYDNVTIDVGEFGPVIGTHVGEGSLGIAWYKE